MSICPVCEEPGIGLGARAARPFTGQLRCRVCTCSLRVRRGALNEAVGWLAWLVLATGVVAAIALASPAVFIVAAALALGIECAAPLDLDERDAPSVRRADRIRRASDGSPP